MVSNLNFTVDHCLIEIQNYLFSMETIKMVFCGCIGVNNIKQYLSTI